MAGRQRCDPGGTRSLLDLIGRHREAIEYDLIGLGLRLDWLGTPALSWRDLWVIANQSPQGSALDRALRPDEWAWGLPEQLLAAATDALRAANWQRAGGRRSDYPQPIPRPGIEPATKVRGRDPVPLDDMRKWLGWDEATTKH